MSTANVINGTPRDSSGMTIDPQVFQTVQEQIDKDSAIKENIREALKKLDRQVRQVQSIFSRVHSVSASEVPRLVENAETPLKNATQELHELVGVVKDYPYYKYNGSWTRDLQTLTYLVLLNGWLDRSYNIEKEGMNGLLTIEEVGEVLGVPVHPENEDKFHLTTEEYLQAIISLVEELARLITNAVTQKDFVRPMRISAFVNDIFSGFQVLNLKNDSLRRRSDGIKYNVKKIEDVVYDLSLRELIPK